MSDDYAADAANDAMLIKSLRADNARLLAEAAETRRQLGHMDRQWHGAEARASALAQRVERLEVGLKSTDEWFAKYYPMALVRPLIERILAEGSSSTPIGPQTGEPNE